MKWKVNYDCGFDENDGDYCEEHGTLYHPTKGGDWIVDDDDQDDMKLLAIINLYLDERQGVESDDDDDDAEAHDFWGAEDDEIIAKMETNATLQKMGVTLGEIKKAVREFNIHYYFPSPHSSMAEPHDHWFNITVRPAGVEDKYIDDDFLLKPWRTEQ